MTSLKKEASTELKLKGKKLKEQKQKIQKQLTQKQSNTSTKLSNLRAAMSENEEDASSRELPIKKRINRLVFLLSSRILNSENKENFIAAIVLLNHALMTVDHDEAMALKIMNIAKRLARKS
jgi:hypothetical protein